jgi:hypothetical protein
MLQMPDNKIFRILYISYDGMLEPLGQSQVLQHLKGLASSFIKMENHREKWLYLILHLLKEKRSLS